MKSRIIIFLAGAALGCLLFFVLLISAPAIDRWLELGELENRLWPGGH